MVLDSSFSDPERLCPMPAGPALLDGRCWTVRLAQGDASIEAPRPLLERVATACDGTRSISQILEEIRPPALRAKVQGLIGDLLQAGVLVDATLYTAAAQRVAWVPSAFGLSADRTVWQEIPRRFAVEPGEHGDQYGAAVTTPLDALIARRHSVRTFDDAAPDECALRAYLWLLCGVVHVENDRAAPRRTIPSGGAVHALRPILVLQKQVGPWTAGVYEVHYPAERRLELRHLGDEVAWLPRALVHPWYLRYATGMVFLVGDPRLGAIKYRARALQYMFIEAGAAFQNAALAAPRLGMAMSVYGGYIETVVMAQLGLSEYDVVVSSAVFGVTPTAHQQRQAAASFQIEFDWPNSSSPIYSTPYHVARCKVVRDDVNLNESWGRDADPWRSFTKALVESIERLGFRSPQRVVQGRFEDFDKALDPRSVIRYANVQYRKAKFGLKPFDESVACGWVRGRSLLGGHDVHVLAELVYSSKSLKEQYAGAWAGYTECNSSGCAAHLDDERALEAALFELVERDAYMRSWLLQQPGTALSARSLPAELRRRIRALELLGCRVSIQQLPSAWAPVCVVYAQHEERHFTVVGAGARRTLAEAACAAMDEMETLAYMNFNGQKRVGLKPSDVKQPADHAFLYALPRHFRRADALLATTRSVAFGKASAQSDITQPLSTRLTDAGHEVVVVDITASGSAIDQGRTPVSVLRALVPGLLPMSFGFNREPLGMLPRFDPRGRFPHPFP